MNYGWKQIAVAFFRTSFTHSPLTNRTFNNILCVIHD